MKRVLLILLLFAVLVSGCTVRYVDTGERVTDVEEVVRIANGEQEEAPGSLYPDGITLAAVGQHSTQEDCWLAIDGKVYDVTDFDAHPGGNAIYQGCGMDATELYETRPMGTGTPHSARAREMLDDYYIGELS